ILQDLLRDELGFEGMVVADYFSLSLLITHHRVAADREEAAVRAIEAGMDLELPETACFGSPLLAAVTAGRVPTDTVDRAVRRVLSAKVALGLFESPFADEEAAPLRFDTLEQRELARRAAASSLVLLTNDDVLPLAQGLARIAVVGPGADDRRLLQGDYHYPAHQELAFDTPSGAGGAAGDGAAPGAAAVAAGDPGQLALLPEGQGEWRPGPHYTRHVTPLAGIRAAVGAGVEVVYAKGCEITGSDGSEIAEAAALAASAEVAVVVVADRSGPSRSSTVGEQRDATHLELTGLQEALVDAVAATGVPTVVVVLSGRVHALDAVTRRAAAVFQAWPLGEEGGHALAQVLFGRVNPAGRLPVSLPRSVGQVPRYLGHRGGGATAMFTGEYADSPTTPLFPFGHGLSYTNFVYDGLTVEATDTANPVIVEVDVANAGERAGDEVVQCYLTDLVASVARPDQQLAGFARVHLAPGETRRVRFEIAPGRLAFTDERLRRVAEPGELRVAVGGSSADLPLEATVRIAGEVTEHPRADSRVTVVSVGAPVSARC
ncbi:MAG: glycoside hydrolase family 3 C-terminal domain-containing protein, partial [Acidimicrobiales bacterium]